MSFTLQIHNEGRAILIRFVWTDLGTNRTHMEQAFSADGGKNWEVNWKYDGTRIGESPKTESSPATVEKKVDRPFLQVKTRSIGLNTSDVDGKFKKIVRKVNGKIADATRRM